MKTLATPLLFLIIGLTLGWTIRPHLSKLFSPKDFAQTDLAQTNATQTTPGQEVQSCGHNTQNQQHQICGNQITSSSVDFEGHLFNLIRQQKVEQTLGILKKMDLVKAENHLFLQAIRNNLHQLAGQKNWLTLTLWVKQMLAEGYDQSILHAMNSKIKDSRGDTLGAIDSLFVAQHHSLSSDEIKSFQEEIEKLVLGTMTHYKNNDHRVSQQSAFEILHFVMEKQPENPLFGIEISYLYADSGDINTAIETLNLIPYSKEYQNIIVSLKTQWLNQLNDTEQITTAIPLRQVDQHYIVTAVINQELTLELLIDTGATTTSLSTEAINDLKLANIIRKREGTVTINTANGHAEANVYRVNRFAIDEYVVEDFDLLEVDLSEWGEFDGLLGMNFLTFFEFELDQSNRQLFLTPKQ